LILSKKSKACPAAGQGFSNGLKNPADNAFPLGFSIRWKRFKPFWLH
jgi:hypothetical protein